MRGGALLGIGTVLMVIALILVGYVAVQALRQDEQAVYTPPAEPAELVPAEPVEELERSRENVPLPEREKAIEPPPVPSEPSPAAPPKVAAPEPREPPPEPPPLPEPRELLPEPLPEPEVKELVTGPPDPGDDLPPADTAASVAVRTCNGGRYMLNVAEKRMFDLHNQARVARELGGLCIAPDLTKLARLRSEDMLARDYFSHYTPEGTMFTDYGGRVSDPRSWAGENLALGTDAGDLDAPEYMFDGLMHSPGHRANILRGAFTEVGVGAKSGTYQQSTSVTTIYTLVYWGPS